MKKEQEEVARFNKDQILTSKRFTTIDKDVLSGILEDRAYTVKEVDEVLKEFKERKIGKETK